MGYLSNVKKQYWISFFYSLIPAYVIERLFWQERGMNVQMVVYAEIIYALTVIVLELPSGMLADKLGRKHMLIVASFLSTVELWIIVMADRFWQFALAVFLAGVGKALSSGSDNALLYDSLIHEGKEADFEKILGRLSAVDFFGSMLAALSGSLVASYYRFELNYVLSICSTCIAMVMTITLKEPPILTELETELTDISQYTKQAMRVFSAQPLVLIYCVSGAVLSGCIIYLDEFWQIVLENIGVPVLYFGAVSALSMVARVPGNLFAYKLKEKFRYDNVLTGVFVISIIAYGAIFFVRNEWFIIVMLLLYVVTGIVEPLIMGYMHHRTDSQVRATVESFSSLGMRLVSIGVGLVFGCFSAKHSIFAGFVSIAFLCLAYWLVFNNWIRKHIATDMLNQ